MRKTDLVNDGICCVSERKMEMGKDKICVRNEKAVDDLLRLSLGHTCKTGRETDKGIVDPSKSRACMYHQIILTYESTQFRAPIHSHQSRAQTMPGRWWHWTLTSSPVRRITA
jgi:hypothetical protein